MSMIITNAFIPLKWPMLQGVVQILPHLLQSQEERPKNVSAKISLFCTTEFYR